ncbi:F-box domain-containing protein [Mycena chlorophos]|uniref:F-box domain-containing protein n=1 Tax=Mycena chlorophos TaxID=658473 RepID=A0A8H6TSI8_MYCCL|nr:F-box domain-containing protein [Mycena chlorophos]
MTGHGRGLENQDRCLSINRTRATSLDAEIPEGEEWLLARKHRLDCSVLSLPNEVVSEIFLHYLPPYPERPPLLGNASPTNLAQICRRWRQIAFTTPVLWRAIEPFENGSPAHHEHRLAVTKRWLERSRSMPLSIALRVHSRDIESQFLSELVPHCRRWQYISVDLTCGDPYETNLPVARIDGDMPHLLELDVAIAEDFTWGPMSPLSAPKLHTLFLNTCGTIYSMEQLSQHISIHWAHLMRLYLHALYYQVAAEVLLQTRRLVECRLDFDDEQGSVNVPVVEVTRELRLPHLEILVLGFSYASRDSRVILESRFLDQLRLPALRQLRVDEKLVTTTAGIHMPVGTQQPEARSMSTVARLLQSFGCQLPNLRVCVADAWWGVEDYTEVLPESVDICVHWHGKEMEPEHLHSFSWGSWKI